MIFHNRNVSRFKILDAYLNEYLSYLLIHIFAADIKYFVHQFLGRKVTGSFVCGDCGWPLCGDTCRHADTHRQECSFFRCRVTCDV